MHSGRSVQRRKTYFANFMTASANYGDTQLLQRNGIICQIDIVLSSLVFARDARIEADDELKSLAVSGMQAAYAWVHNAFDALETPNLPTSDADSDGEIWP